jgi:hypothetical protein
MAFQFHDSQSPNARVVDKILNEVAVAFFGPGRSVLLAPRQEVIENIRYSFIADDDGSRVDVTHW